MSEYPIILTQAQVRFEILFALQQVGKSTINQWAGKDRLKRYAAREQIVSAVLARFDRLQVAGPPPLPNHGERS